jgi:exonuclease III
MRRVRKLAEPSRVRIGTWNVGSLTGKLREVVDTMIMWCVNILCIQETKWMGQKAKKVGIVLDKSRYRLQTLIHRKYVNQE